MSKITLDEFCAQWVPGKWTTAMASRLENNAFDFATVAGEYAKEQFQASFAVGGFNGKRWAPRTSRWGRKFTHPVMNDTGALARGIEGEAGRVDIVGRRADRTRIFRKGAYYWIHTTEKSTPERGKRGRKKAVPELRRRPQHGPEIRTLHREPVLLAASRAPSLHRILTEDRRACRLAFHRHDF